MSVRVQPKATPDPILLGATLVLVGIGVEMVYSASFVSSGTSLLVRQSIWAGIGLLVLVLATALDYHRLERHSAVIMAAAVVLLFLVLVPGVSSDKYGAHRWIGIRGVQEFQPSEVTKLAMIVYMSAWLGRKREQVKELGRGFLPFALMLGLVTFAIMAEPDMGTAFVVAVTATCIFFVAGANPLHFLALGAAGVAGFAYLMIAASYRLDRFMAFLNPWSDVEGTGWHTVQTLIALGSGGTTGLGLGASRQKFFWVPNAHTDSIFAIIGEELGLLGATFVILLFGVIAWRGFTAAMRAPDMFGRLIATGVTCVIMVQSLTNIAVVTNTLPNTGITLPLISYGGSSLVVTMAGIGLLLSVSRFAGAVQPSAEPRGEPGGTGLTGILRRKPARARSSSSAGFRPDRRARNVGNN